MKITYLVHTITTDNESGIATGWLHGKASEEGIKRAKGLRAELQSRDFEAVYCSDLERSTESAELFFQKKLPVHVDERLRECSYGKFDGKPGKEFKKGREKEYINKPYPDGESCKDVESRMAEFLEDLKKTGYKHIAIVAHHIPQLALDVMLKGMTWEEAFDKDWRNTKDWQPGWVYELS